MTGAIGLGTELLTATGRLVAAAVPGLGEDAANAVVVQVAGHARPLRELHDHLTAHPDALVSRSSDQVPPSVIRLIKQLAAQGFSAVRVPACLRCGRTDRNLPRRVAGGRLCFPCAQKVNAQVCADCGQLRGVHARADRGPLCSRCAGRPKRVCGVCGKTRRVGLRATETSPDLCQECLRTELSPCAVCGRTTRCRRTGDGRRVCPSCIRTQVAPRDLCCRCGQLRPVNARWPAGPVCHTCYERALTTPRPCRRCGRRGVLTGTDSGGSAICATCAGSHQTYDCLDCGQACRPYAGGRCARRVLAERVHDLLKVNDHPQYLDLAAALTGADNPRVVIRWLNGTSGGILAALVSTGQPLTHATIDALPNGSAVRYLRDLLITTAVLPERDDYIERVAAWIDRVLVDRPTHHITVLRPYAWWDVMTRARRRHRQRQRPSTSATSQYLRQKICIAADFLTWLDEHTTSLEQLTQTDLELYLTGRNGTSVRLQGFIAWLRRRRLIGDVTMPRRTSAAQPAPIPEHELWQQLQRCLNQAEQIPLHIRVVATLLLLYGNPVTHTVALTSDDLQQHGDRCYLTLADRPVLLPPALAHMLTDLQEKAESDSTISRAIKAPPWLFPGRHPGTHRDGPGLTTALAAHGIAVRPTRTAALMALAAQLPAAVLGPLLGLHPHTAVKWSNLVKRDWTAYIAARLPSHESDPPRSPSSMNIARSQ